jgi:hypothetical protein
VCSAFGHSNTSLSNIIHTTFTQMTMNLDFSFIRFLKVVKTLYETSTFTQLGKTVGSALGPLALANMTTAESTEENGHDENERLKRVTSNEGSTLFDALVEACSPGRKLSPTSMDDLSPTSQTAHEDEKKSEELTHGRHVRGDSLFERVINCTLLGAPEEEEGSDDEDTFKTRTYDENSYYEESYTENDSSEDDEYQEQRARRSRRSRRR